MLGTDIWIETAMPPPSGDAANPLTVLFHRLNNELGTCLAQAELLELKAPDESSRTRATQLVSAISRAMQTTREIRVQLFDQ